jgi:hypothetical protein
MNPARYSAGIEVLVSAPKMIRLIEGGIRMPSVPDAAMEPRNSGSL